MFQPLWWLWRGRHLWPFRQGHWQQLFALLKRRQDGRLFIYMVSAWSVVCGAGFVSVAGRDASRCLSHSGNPQLLDLDRRVFGFSPWPSTHNRNMAVDFFTPRTLARPGAASPLDCLSEYSQLQDGSWWLPLSSSVGVNVTSGVADFAGCVNLCDQAQCQLVTYDYVTQECSTRVALDPVLEGSPWVALKALPSSSHTATSAASTSPVQAAGEATGVTAKAASGGAYTFYTDPNGLDIGYQSQPDGADKFTSVQDCADVCDVDQRCAGWVILPLLRQSKVATTCRLIRGDDSTGRFKRTMIRTDVDHIAFPAAYLCPSGLTVSEDSTTCTPITTMQQATMVMLAQGGCTIEAIASVKASLQSYLSNPDVAFGVYTPNLRLEVSCMTADGTTVSSTDRAC